MIAIIAQRGNGDRPGADITEPLLNNLDVMRERGRVELDRYEPQSPVTLLTTYQPNIMNGDIIKIVDAGYGPVWYGKITSIEHVMLPGGAVTSLNVLRRL